MLAAKNSALDRQLGFGESRPPHAPIGILPKQQHRRAGGEQPAEPDQGEVERHPVSMRGDSGV